MRVFFTGIIFVLSSCSFADNFAAVLIPESMISESMQMEIDWLIEDMDAPKSDFGKAVAKQLGTVGVKSSVSATYQSTANAAELYSLEVYEFVETFTLEQSVTALKPGVIEKYQVVDSQISGYPAISIAVENSEIQLFCVKANTYLIIVGVVNDTTDIRSFAEKYIKWFSAQPFND